MTPPPGLGSWTARRARATPERTALVHGSRRLTYAALDDRVRALAAGLAGLGVERGDRVAYLDPTTRPSSRRCSRRRPSARCSSRSTRGWRRRSTRSRSTTPGPGCSSTPRPSMSEESRGRHRTEGSTPIGDSSDARGRGLLRGPRHPHRGPSGPRRRRPRRHRGPALHLRHHRPAQGGAALAREPHLERAQRPRRRRPGARRGLPALRAPLPRRRARDDLPAGAAQGRTLVLEEAFDVDRTLDLVPAERVTIMFGVPTMFAALARAPRFEDTDLASVRYLLCGGAPVPPALLERYAQRGLTFLQGYGMTEAAPGVLLLDREHAREKTGTAGRPHFFSDVRLADTGEVLVRGPNVVDGYWRRPQESADAFDSGSTPTGVVPVGRRRHRRRRRVPPHRRPRQGPLHLRRRERLAGRGRGCARPRTPTSSTRRWSGSPTSAGARPGTPGWCSPRTRPRPRPTCSPTSTAGSPASSTPAGSRSSTRCRATPREARQGRPPRPVGSARVSPVGVLRRPRPHSSGRAAASNDDRARFRSRGTARARRRRTPRPSGPRSRRRERRTGSAARAPPG